MARYLGPEYCCGVTEESHRFHDSYDSSMTTRANDPAVDVRLGCSCVILRTMKGDVHATLQRDIVDGVFSPGEPLVELALAERYNVSRTPIREALRKLEADGLVEQFARGYRVSQHSPQDILDLYDVRIALEQVAARSAAERRTPFDLAKLRQAQQALSDTVAASDSAWASSACAHAFHAALWEATHNKMLIATLESLERRITAFSSSTLSYPGRGSTIVEEHAQIVEAVSSGAAELAGKLNGEHMSQSRDIRLELYARFSPSAPHGY